MKLRQVKDASELRSPAEQLLREVIDIPRFGAKVSCFAFKVRFSAQVSPASPAYHRAARLRRRSSHRFVLPISSIVICVVILINCRLVVAATTIATVIGVVMPRLFRFIY